MEETKGQGEGARLCECQSERLGAKRRGRRKLGPRERGKAKRRDAIDGEGEGEPV